MLVSLFLEFVQKWFAPLSKNYTEKINGGKSGPTYLFMSMLKKDFSTDQKWDSKSISTNIVAADVVALDTELPLKKRDSISKASGELPKLGMKFSKGEKEITDINTMIRMGATEEQIAGKLFDDVPKCISGVYERLEMCFLQSLSDGVTLVSDDDNPGTGIRVDFGFKDSNKFGAQIKWGQSGYTPLADLAKVIGAANDAGNSITKIMIGLTAYNHLRTSDEAKVLVANFRNQVVTNSALIPIPPKEAFNEAMNSEYNVQFIVVDRTVKVEKDGKRKNIKPFNPDKVVFLTSDVVGKLVYGTLAEEGSPVSGVEYQKVDDYILISKYSKNDSLREFTSSQAIVLPVLENVDEIYILDTQEAIEVASTETEGDATITINDEKFTKSEVIAAYKTALGVTINANIGDAKLIAKINDLSEEDAAKFQVEIDKLTPVE